MSAVTNGRARPVVYQLVVGYDFSEPAGLALDRALALADTAKRHVLHVVTALDDAALGRPVSARQIDDTRGRLRAVIEGRLDAMSPENPIEFFVHVRTGNPADEILWVARDVGAHVILVGSCGRTGLKRVVLGSVSEKVVRAARCPVLVIRERRYADVDLLRIVDAAPERADASDSTPHRYSYRNRVIEHSDPNRPLN